MGPPAGVAEPEVEVLHIRDIKEEEDLSHPGTTQRSLPSCSSGLHRRDAAGRDPQMCARWRNRVQRRPTSLHLQGLEQRQ